MITVEEALAAARKRSLIHHIWYRFPKRALASIECCLSVALALERVSPATFIRRDRSLLNDPARVVARILNVSLNYVYGIASGWDVEDTAPPPVPYVIGPIPSDELLRHNEFCAGYQLGVAVRQALARENVIVMDRNVPPAGGTFTPVGQEEET